jgi:hypothetical protein
MALVTANDILRDIEFELVQGVVSRDDLGKGIQAVKQFQNEARTETFQTLKPAGANREIIVRQFQINDMLITLLQEMTAAIQAMQLESQKKNRASVATRTALSTSSIRSQDNDLSASVELGVTDNELYQKLMSEIEHVTQPNALWVEFQPRSIGLPIIGWFITRGRAVLHRLVLFYVQRFATKQAPINKTFSDWILYLVQLAQDQHEQLKILHKQVALLQTRVVKLEKPSSLDKNQAA